MAENYAPASSVGSLFPSNDGLAKLSDLAVRIAGKELNEEGLQAIAFLKMHGSLDLVQHIMADKVYMTDGGELRDTIERVNSAQFSKDMMKAQSAAVVERMRG